MVGRGLARFQTLWAAIPALTAALMAVGCSDAPRTPETIFVELASMPPPKDEKDLQANMTYRVKRAELIKEFYGIMPQYPEMAQMLSERWDAILTYQSPATVLEETEQVLKEHGKPDDGLGHAATYFKALAMVRTSKGQEEKAVPAIEAFLTRLPKHDQTPTLFRTLAMQVRNDEKMTQYEDMIIKDLPDHPISTDIKKNRRLRDPLGQPFDLNFKDVLTGKPVTMETLKGKVLVIDFWGVWCQPCIRDLPKMKEIYAAYQTKGVEFIGVAIDGDQNDPNGLAKLKEFTEKQKMSWPQYHHDAPMQSELFAEAWGIMALPSVFLIDAEGKVASVNARGRLEELLPKMLANKGKLSRDDAMGPALDPMGQPIMDAAPLAPRVPTPNASTTPPGAKP